MIMENLFTKSLGKVIILKMTKKKRAIR